MRADQKKGSERIQSAAISGSADAHYLLGELFEHGRPGVEQDGIQAIAHSKIADEMNENDCDPDRSLHKPLTGGERFPRADVDRWSGRCASIIVAVIVCGIVAIPITIARACTRAGRLINTRRSSIVHLRRNHGNGAYVSRGILTCTAWTSGGITPSGLPQRAPCERNAG